MSVWQGDHTFEGLAYRLASQGRIVAVHSVSKSEKSGHCEDPFFIYASKKVTRDL